MAICVGKHPFRVSDAIKREIYRFIGKCRWCRLLTGHYVQRIETDRGVSLTRGADQAKDQSYFVCHNA